jgi:hypothetical protein
MSALQPHAVLGRETRVSWRMAFDRHLTARLLFSSGMLGACGGETPAVASASASVSAPASAASQPSSSGAASSAPPATASAEARSVLAEKFAQPIPADLKPAAIYAGQQQSGLIVLLPPAFNMSFWGHRVGFSALSSPTPGVALANLSIEVSADTKPLQPGPAKATSRCDGLWFKNGTWTESEQITMTDGQALVWAGADAGGAGRAGRRAYLVEALVGKKRVLACGSWDPTHPELELAVVTALSSIRAGSAPPGNYEN